VTSSWCLAYYYEKKADVVHSAISDLDSVMPHIKQIPVGEATGLLKKLFDEALERAGRIWHIVHIMSLNPRAMDSSMKLYAAIMFGRSPLTRWRREMLAVVTSRTNDCFY
jgi:alkylhydroperoxidase family enzyme